jgi:predicted metal-binding transcription factor (methanogenesis marker protein 9)
VNINKAKLLCYICGIVDGLSDHHLNPRELGGTDHKVNLITLCLKHHDWAEDKSFDQIERERERYQFDRYERGKAAQEIVEQKKLKYTLKEGEHIGMSGLIWGCMDEVDCHGRVSRVVHSRTPEPEELVWLRQQREEKDIDRERNRTNKAVQELLGGAREGAGRPKSLTAKSGADRAKIFRAKHRNGNQPTLPVQSEALVL